MKAIRFLAFTCVVITWVCCATPARATDEHTYRPHEFATIWHGASPDGNFRIATHGDGEGGFENFHAYLFSEHGSRRVGPLEEVNDNLDTGPLSFVAYWSSDSQHVAILYRTDRHVIRLLAYRIEARRAYPVNVPSLIPNGGMASRSPDAREAELKSRYFRFRWINTHQFELTEIALLYSHSENEARSFGKFSEYDKDDDSKPSHPGYWVNFGAHAQFALDRQDRATPMHIQFEPFNASIDLSPTLSVDHGDVRNSRTSLQIK